MTPNTSKINSAKMVLKNSNYIKKRLDLTALTFSLHRQKKQPQQASVTQETTTLPLATSWLLGLSFDFILHFNPLHSSLYAVHIYLCITCIYISIYAQYVCFLSILDVKICVTFWHELKVLHNICSCKLYVSKSHYGSRCHSVHLFMSRCLLVDVSGTFCFVFILKTLYHICRCTRRFLGVLFFTKVLLASSPSSPLQLTLTDKKYPLEDVWSHASQLQDSWFDTMHGLLSLWSWPCL